MGITRVYSICVTAGKRSVSSFYQLKENEIQQSGREMVGSPVNHSSVVVEATDLQIFTRKKSREKRILDGTYKTLCSLLWVILILEAALIDTSA